MNVISFGVVNRSEIFTNSLCSNRNRSDCVSRPSFSNRLWNRVQGIFSKLTKSNLN